ncbi:AAA family ATPase [Corynebacterium sp.]|jgi:DNA repair exonuclease SbcCD ATPase subunit|uniref:AAA family ATPase n=1 Tax=Corynebacterium sp. TaxID=1720 RepID=UPI0025C488EC|nr:AAA family ATPase [Corynebacterium sp.]
MLNFRSLTLSHVAGVTHAHLEFPESGVLVVHGPNEVGKSTLLRAIRLLLDDTPTGSRKREVKALKDVSVDEPTTISAELVVGDVELQLMKAYNKGTGRCELRVTAPRAESLTGREASDRFAEIMRAEVDTDLLDALTVEQGASLDQLAVAGLGPLERALNGQPGDGGDGTAAEGGAPGTVADHRDAGGAGGAAALVERITAERARYFTPGGKPTKELKAALDEYTAASEEHAGAEKAYDQAQSLIIDLERLRAEKETVAKQEPLAREEAKAAAVEVEKGRERQRLLDERAAALTGARQKLELAEQRQQVRQDRIAELSAAVEAGERATAEATAAAEAAEGARQEEARLRTELARSRRRARTTAAYVRYLDAVRHRDTLAQRLRTLQEQRAEAARIAEEITAVRERIDDNPVTAEVAAAVQGADAELTRAVGVRDASATLIELSGLPGGRFTVDGEEQELDDAPQHLRVTSRRTLQLGDFTLTVTPAQGTESGAHGDDLSEAVDRARAGLESALADAGSGSVGEVTRKAEQRRRLGEELAELRITVSQATGGLGMEEFDQSLDECGRELRRAESALTNAADQLATEDPEREVDLPEADPEEAPDRDALLRRIEEHEARAEKIREELDTLARTGAAAVLGSRVEEQKRAADRVTELSAAVEAMREETGDDELNTRVAEARREVEEAAGELERTTAEIDPGTGDLDTLEGLLAGAESRVHRLRDRADRIGHEISRANGALGEHSGVAERLETATSRLQRARRVEERVTRQARAVDTLYRAVQAARDDARRRYEAPYRDSVESLARTLYGRAVSIEFDEDLRISRRVLDATALDAAQLSGGAREQLAILSRLAVADIVGRGEGVPVVIDDALGFSDTSRIHRMNVVLSQLAKTNQVIVLTCDPARFDSVPGATVRSMAELQS